MKSSSTSIRKRMRPLINLALIFGLLAALAIYLLAISNLGGFLYSAPQEQFLAYNEARRIYQAAPTWSNLAPGAEKMEDGKPAPAQAALEPAAFSDWKSRVEATLMARYEEQAGVSVTSYDLTFDAEYELVYSSLAESGAVEMVFPFPGNLETLHEVRFLVDGSEPENVSYTTSGIRWVSTLVAGQRHTLAVRYKADGVNSFGYALNQNSRSDVDVVLRVRGVSGTSVTRDSLPTSSQESGEEEEVLAWQYADLIPSRNIRIELPRRLSFAQRVEQLEDHFTLLAGLAPFLVGMFLATLALLLRASGVHLRLEAYLLMGLCLVAFYPALTFLSGLVYLYAAAALAFVSISALVLAFLGVSAGWRRTLFPAGWSLFVFLGVLSLGQFLPWRGLVFTIGGVLLVATFMGLYALHARQARQAAGQLIEPGDLSTAGAAQATAGQPTEGESPLFSTAEAAPGQADETGDSSETLEAAPVEDTPASAAEPPVTPAAEEISSPPAMHCPRCGRALGEGFHFCAGCGYDVQVLHPCPACGKMQLLPQGMDEPHCVYCGEGLTVR